eukprot:8938402-Karenia_brevis.AAC.1
MCIRDRAKAVQRYVNSCHRFQPYHDEDFVMIRDVSGNLRLPLPVEKERLMGLHAAQRLGQHVALCSCGQALSRARPKISTYYL